MVLLLIGKDLDKKYEYIEQLNKHYHCQIISRNSYYNCSSFDSPYCGRVHTDLLDISYLMTEDNIWSSEKTYIIIDSLMFTRYDNQLEDLLMKHKEYGIEVILVMDAPMNLSTKIKSNIDCVLNVDKDQYRTIKHDCENCLCINADFSKLYDYF